jgi:hypothetical protein
VKTFTADGLLKRRRLRIGAILRQFVRDRPSADAADLVADAIGDRLSQVRLQGAGMAGFEVLQMRE